MYMHLYTCLIIHVHVCQLLEMKKHYTSLHARESSDVYTCTYMYMYSLHLVVHVHVYNVHVCIYNVHVHVHVCVYLWKDQSFSVI